MGNQVCCEENIHRDPEHMVTILHKTEPIQIPELSKEVKDTLAKQRPFEEDLPEQPTIKEYGNDVYEGSIDQKGQPIGFGKMYHKNGSLFVGNFENGAANGPGFYIKADGSYYKGLMKNNKAEDKKGYIWSPNYEYQGGVKDNAPHGEGRESSSTHMFEGTYDEGKKKSGVMKWEENQEKLSYEGEFDDEGLFDGKGELDQPSKGLYKGDFRKGEKHGTGIFFFKNKLRYEGQYEHNVKSGRGVVYNHNDTVAYEGEFKNGLPHGKGKTGSSTGSSIERTWVNGIDSVLLEQ